jgi:hypothetical protein
LIIVVCLLRLGHFLSEGHCATPGPQNRLGSIGPNVLSELCGKSKSHIHPAPLVALGGAFGLIWNLIVADSLGARARIMLKKIAATISVTAFMLLCIALAPHVPTALATAGHDIDDTNLSETVATQSCASFEVWFLDPTCSRLRHAKKVGRLGHKASW